MHGDFGSISLEMGSNNIDIITRKDPGLVKSQLRNLALLWELEEVAELSL